MSTSEFLDLSSQFRQLLGQCRELYVSSGELCAHEHSHLLPKSGEHYVQLMDDLHRALLVKVFVSICEADRRWSKNEQRLAEVLLFHLWNQRLEGDRLKESLVAMSEKAMSLKWYALVRPFDQIAPLRDRVGELETIVTRLANIVARADGPMRSSEAARVKMIQEELNRHLREIPIDEPELREQANEARIETIRKILKEANKLPDTRPSATQTASGQGASAHVAVETKDRGETDAGPSPEQLEQTLAELDRLIGLTNIKHEIHTLANFLNVQSQREKAGLPATNLSLHMVFDGNPGTGKTTVARIIGKVFGAMGVLKKGHLVETDRSGLVAEYAGQTGPKTNTKIDEALDGVLFIDEAYTLISAKGEDPFGHEAVQTLLKRMEDDRTRLVVILAGYPAEIRTLLRSNPGLLSRFNRRLEFTDYTPLELSQIFGLMCDKNHYTLPPLVRAKVLVGLDYLYQHRDLHFGNGRTSRNLFEQAIRRMANRIAEIAELTVEQLTRLQPEDIEFKTVPAGAFDCLTENDSLRFHIICPDCKRGTDAPQKYLGQRVRCLKCKHKFEAAWGALVREKE